MRTSEVVVIGGGPTGIGASLAASRTGAKTLLIERYGFLGGMTTAGLVSHWDPIELMEISGLPMEVYKRLKAANGARDFPYQKIDMPSTFWEAGCGIDVEVYKQIVEDLIEEAGVELLLHSFVTEVVREGNRIVAVSVVNKSGRQEISGDQFVDATGDGDVAALAGCNYRKGSEDGQLMAATLSFTVGGVNSHAVEEYLVRNPDDFGTHPRLGKFLKNVETSSIWQGFNKLIDEAHRHGDLDLELPEQGIGMSRLPIDGQFHVNAIRITGIDGTKVEDLTQGEKEQRRQVRRVFDFMKKYIPGFGDAYIIATASQIGVRETRRIQANYLFTLADMENGQQFDDAVFQAKWGHSDVHSGRDMKWEFKLVEGPYQVPYRCLIAKDLENLSVGGRSIWAERQVIGSLRIQPMCMLTGQVAGTAAGIAAQSGASLSKIDVRELQNALRKQAVNVPL